MKEDNFNNFDREMALVIITVLVCAWFAFLFYLGTKAEISAFRRISSGGFFTFLFVWLPAFAGYKLKI